LYLKFVAIFALIVHYVFIFIYLFIYFLISLLGPIDQIAEYICFVHFYFISIVFFVCVFCYGLMSLNNKRYLIVQCKGLSILRELCFQKTM
jgi:hypothetical protein